MSKLKTRMILAGEVIFRFVCTLHRYHNSLLFPIPIFLTASLWLLPSSLLTTFILLTHHACKHLPALLYIPAQAPYDTADDTGAGGRREGRRRMGTGQAVACGGKRGQTKNGDEPGEGSDGDTEGKQV